MWMATFKLKLLITLLICGAVYQSYAHGLSGDDWEFVNLVHRSFCGTQSLCTPPDKVLVGNANDATTNTTRSIDSLPVTKPFEIDPGCCEPCSCNTSTCFDFGNCCPDILGKVPTLQHSQEPKMVSCQNMSLEAIGLPESNWVYGLCSPDFVVGTSQTAVEIKSKCENRERHFDLDARLPFVDPLTQRVYANRFCAICGFANQADLIPLTPRLACYDGAQFTKSVTKDNLIQDVLNTFNCDLEFHWNTTQVGFPPPYCRHVETQCNVTGFWWEYDPFIEAACHAYRADYNYKYNNVFCYMCNEVDTLYQCTEALGREIGTLSFGAVLDFSRERNFAISNPIGRCTNAQVYDHYKNVCRDLTCVFPRMLQNGECVNVGDEVVEVAYKLQIKFQPNQVYQSQELDIMIKMLGNYISSLMKSLGSEKAMYSYNFYYKLNFTAADNSKSSNMDPIEGVTVPFDLPFPPSGTVTDASPTVTTTTAPNVLGKSRRRKRQAEIPTQGTDSTPLPTPESITVGASPELPPNQDTMVLVVDYILWEVEMYFTSMSSGSHSKDFLDNVLKLDDTNTTLNDPATGKSFSFGMFIADYENSQLGTSPVDPLTNRPLIWFPIYAVLPLPDLIMKVTAPVQTLKRTLVCPLVTIASNDLNFTEVPDGVYVGELNTTFQREIYKIEIGDQSEFFYLICKDAFMSATDGFMQNQTTEGIRQGGVTPQGVLSVICACISIVCALITLVTYVLLSELRTQPGINNMMLCVYLICAQMFFTFAVIQEDSVSEGVCSFFGGLSHLFWLMVVFAMNVCCYYMARVFIGQSTIRSKSDSRLKQTILFTVYCLVLSLVFVVINIIVVYVDTDKEKTGYGDGLCYISRPEMVGYVFALPLGVVLLINLAFFVTVVVKISRSPTVSSTNKKDRNYFKIYAKLSSVTGLTWIFGFLFQFTDQVIFEYLFIILNGGIGVLIFVSFVCNKRVYKLYKGKIVGKVPKGKAQTSVNSSKTQETSLNTISQSTTNA